MCTPQVFGSLASHGTLTTTATLRQKWITVSRVDPSHRTAPSSLPRHTGREERQEAWLDYSQGGSAQALHYTSFDPWLSVRPPRIGGAQLPAAKPPHWVMARTNVWRPGL